jgi:alginate O-acetyltransferase complex protein AlgI
LLFHSFAFLVFFPVVAALFFATPARHRWVLLLGASYYFYAAWKPEYLVLIVASTLVDYLVGLRLGAETAPRKRRAWLAVSLVANLGILFAFKYANFFGASVQAAFRATNVMLAVPRLEVLLPVGISFYTFQTLSYTIDLYRGEREPERHLGRFALYVSFFPQLVAGPIERSTRLLPQLARLTAKLDGDRIARGLGLVVWGLFKKAVIADRAALFVDAVFADPERFGGPTIIVATYLFAFQIYCDFSGYSDIAIGSAKVLGVDLMENFERPYWSPSIASFWRRWHVSLSTWFRDYLYLPLGGRRVGMGRWAFNILVVFVLSGLWHGASWTFVIWGAFHGLLLLLTRAGSRAWDAATGSLSADARKLLATALGVPITFHLVCFGWLIFRADDLSHLSLLLARIPVIAAPSVLDDLTSIGPAPAAALVVELAVLGLSIVALELAEWLRRRPSPAPWPLPLRWSAWGLLSGWLLLTATQTHTPFLYFQF